ncbi:hypothetical protein EVAR_35302_1 [Eumeta japonica]|uniref:Uncharacterized protein n=1 Tax=Eumeta variegata TaxID=151549 RepID=A0A4C1XK95_EUMVA|nr:hypothetical protein EVAR_35302_1 [Eumeta japonica]
MANLVAAIEPRAPDFPAQKFVPPDTMGEPGTDPRRNSLVMSVPSWGNNILIFTDIKFCKLEEIERMGGQRHIEVLPLCPCSKQGRLCSAPLAPPPASARWLIRSKLRRHENSTGSAGEHPAGRAPTSFKSSYCPSSPSPGPKIRLPICFYDNTKKKLEHPTIKKTFSRTEIHSLRAPKAISLTFRFTMHKAAAVYGVQAQLFQGNRVLSFILRKFITRRLRHAVCTNKHAPRNGLLALASALQR